MCGGGGGTTVYQPSAPDPTPAMMAQIASNEKLADQQMGIQTDLIGYYKKRQDAADVVSNDAISRQLAMAEETQAQGNDLYNYQKQVFRPVEESLADQAMQQSTPEYYEKYAQQAVAAQAVANANAQDQSQRALTSMGVNPNSGAFASMQRGIDLSNAAGLGAVANQSRDQAEDLAWARRADVAGLGKGLVGAGDASYGLAQGSISAAGNLANQTNQTAAGMLGNPAQYGSNAVGASGNATQGYTSVYGTQGAASRPLLVPGSQDDGMAGAFGQIAGMGLNAAIAAKW